MAQQLEVSPVRTCEADVADGIVCDECGRPLVGEYLKIEDVGTNDSSADPLYLPDTWMACCRECADKLMVANDE